MGMRLLLLLALASVLLLQLEPASAFDRRAFFTLKKTPKPVTDPIVQDSAQVQWECEWDGASPTDDRLCVSSQWMSSSSCRTLVSTRRSRSWPSMKRLLR